MSAPKYAPLTEYLRRQTARWIELSFAEIERVLGRPLPERARHPDWWNDRFSGRRPQCDAWRRAGYLARLLECRTRVRFESAP